MHDSDDWARRLNPPRRNHFFYGKMMGIAQFEREQRYGMGQRWLMNRLSLGTGILSGLQAAVVVLPDAGQRIRLEPGVAVDPLGREIVVQRRFDFDPFKAPAPCGCGGSPPPTEAGTYQLCISYHECGADQLAVPAPGDCEGVSDCDFDTTVETYLLSLRKVPAPTPSSFDCTWTRPVPVAEPPDPATRPATPEELKRRLADMLRSMGASVPTDTCVVLGTVEIAGSPAAFTIGSVSPNGRVYLYSQAELFEMILCLARCCGEHPVTPPVDDETLRLMDVNFRWNPSRIENPGDVVIPLDSLEGTTIDARPRGDVWDPLFLELTFNKPLDGTTVSSILSENLGIAITYTAPDTAPGVPAQRLTVASFLPDAHIVMFSVPGAPGTYEVVLSGTSTTERAAIRSWGEHRELDGEPRLPTGIPPDRPVPSGEKHDHGDFVFTFILKSPDVTPNTFKVRGVTFLSNDVPIATLGPDGFLTLQRNMDVNGIRFDFNAEVDHSTVRLGKSVTVTIGGIPVQGSITVDQSDASRSFLFRRPPDLRFDRGVYDVTLFGDRAGGADVIRSASATTPPVMSKSDLDGGPRDGDLLPSGDDIPGGNFSFSFEVVDP